MNTYLYLLLAPIAVPVTIFAPLFALLDWLGPIPVVNEVIDLYYKVMESIVVIFARIIYFIITGVLGM